MTLGRHVLFPGLTRSGEAAVYDPVADGPAWTHSYYAEGDEMQALAYASGGAVSSWPDESSTADAVQATGANQPLFRVSGVRKYVQGDGADDYLVATYGADIPGPRTRVLVASMEVSASVNVAVSGLLSTKAATIFVHSNDKYRINNSGTGVEDGFADTDWHLFVSVGNGTTQILELDGVEVINTVTAGTTHALSGLTMFANNNTALLPSSSCIHFVADFAGDVRADPAWAAFEAWALKRAANFT